MLKQVWDESPTKVKLARNGFVDNQEFSLCGTKDDKGNYLKCTDKAIIGQKKIILGNRG